MNYTIGYIWFSGGIHLTGQRKLSGGCITVTNTPGEQAAVTAVTLYMKYVQVTGVKETPDERDFCSPVAYDVLEQEITSRARTKRKSEEATQ